jgi:hypothetical protein
MNQPTLSVPALGPLPLLLGVTGHRDFREEDRPALAKAVTRFLEKL